MLLGENGEKTVPDLPIFCGIAGDVEFFLYRATTKSSNNIEIIIRQRNRNSIQLVNIDLKQPSGISVTMTVPCQSVV